MGQAVFEGVETMYTLEQEKKQVWGIVFMWTTQCALTLRTEADTTHLNENRDLRESYAYNCNANPKPNTSDFWIISLLKID